MRTSTIAMKREHRVLLAVLLFTLLLTALAAGLAASAADASAAGIARPGRPAAKSPLGGIPGAKPLFTWGKAARAKRYELRVYRSGTLVVRKTGLTGLSWRCSVALDKNVALTWKVRARNTAGAGAWSASRHFKVTLAIGDLYGGGRVAYILQSGDPGYVAAETHGLIAAEADLTSSDPWGVTWTNFTDSLIGPAAQGSALGTGRANTAVIVAQTIETQHCVEGAAYLCFNLVQGGYDDWYLPSKDELHRLYLMYLRLSNAGEHAGFNPSTHNQAYWSSTESPTNEYGLVLAWYEFFDNDPEPGADLQNTHFKTQEFSVRAVRSF